MNALIKTFSVSNMLKIREAITFGYESGLMTEEYAIKLAHIIVGESIDSVAIRVTDYALLVYHNCVNDCEY